MSEDAATQEPVAGQAANRAAGSGAWLRDRFEAGVEGRLTATLLFIVLGVVMVMVAGYLGIGSVRFDGVLRNGFDVMQEASPQARAAAAFPKEVGYFYAPNWAAFSCLVAPFIIFAGIGVLQSIRTTLPEMCARGMIRDKDFRPAPLSAVEPLLTAHLRRSRRLFVLIFAVVMIYMLMDWWKVVGHPILAPDTVRAPLSDPNMEYDWSVASLYPDQTVNPWGLLLFGLIGYAILAPFTIAFFIGVLLTSVYFVSFVIELDRKSNYRLVAVPEPDFADPYWGFRSFEFFFNNLLIACMLIMLALWLMLVQNIYLRDAASPDIAGFVLRDLVFAWDVVLFKKGVSDAVDWATEPAFHTLSNPQVALSALLTPVVCLLALGMCWILLRTAALKARKLAHLHLDEVAGEIGEARETALPHLRAMRIWPVGWISSWQMAAMMLFFIASMLSYQLVFVPLAFIAWKLGGMLAVSVRSWLYNAILRPPQDPDAI